MTTLVPNMIKFRETKESESVESSNPGLLPLAKSARQTTTSPTTINPAVKKAVTSMAFNVYLFPL